MEKLIIVGAGGFSTQVIEIVELINERKPLYELMGIVDDKVELQGEKILGYSILGPVEYLKKRSEKESISSVIAISEPSFKEEISKKLKNVKWINLIHPAVVISKYTQIGEGNVIGAGTVINPEAIICNHCHINIGNTIGHDVLLEDYVTVMPGTRISGNVKVEKKVKVGTNATVLQGLTIGKETVLGAGTVLIKNAEARCVYVGVPGYIKRRL